MNEHHISHDLIISLTPTKYVNIGSYNEVKEWTLVFNQKGIIKTLNEIIDEYNNYSQYENNFWYFELTRDGDNNIECFMETWDISDSWNVRVDSKEELKEIMTNHFGKDILEIKLDECYRN